jgi:GT2 family glycosyltransferase
VRESAPVTAIVTAFREIDKTLQTLSRIYRCKPAPEEVLVHVDGGQNRTADAIHRRFPAATLLLSSENIGPGGGRNKLITAAKCEFVASFDDDSYPLDVDYFERVEKAFGNVPNAAILSAALFHPEDEILVSRATAEWVADFAGGACVYRRSVFVKTKGYVSLANAYGMEEVDLALRYHAEGFRILRTHSLRVFHDSDRSRHADSKVNAASIANIGLLVLLRYPRLMWPLGFLQWLNRIVWCVRNGRLQGLWDGTTSTIPLYLAHRDSRQVVPARKVLSYLWHRRRSEPVLLPDFQTPMSASEERLPN